MSNYSREDIAWMTLYGDQVPFGGEVTPECYCDCCSEGIYLETYDGEEGPVDVIDVTYMATEDNRKIKLCRRCTELIKFHSEGVQ